MILIIWSNNFFLFTCLEKGKTLSILFPIYGFEKREEKRRKDTKQG
jgi:hypothetical protein